MGNGSYGELGFRGFHVSSPKPVGDLPAHVDEIATGAHHVLALDSGLVVTNTPSN